MADFHNLPQQMKGGCRNGLSISTKCLKKLAHLGPASYQQIAPYVTLLKARNYAHSTIYNLVLNLKGFLDRLPPPRQALFLEDLTLTTPTDLDHFVTSARRQGLQPATINSALSLLIEFFEYLQTIKKVISRVPV